MKGRRRGEPSPVDRAPKRCPSPPSWLSDYAKAEWKRVAPELFTRKLLAPDTMATLESYASAAGTVRECEIILNQQGRIVETDAGPKKHPAFTVQMAAMREVRLFAGELGLTPNRRPKNTGDEGKGDGWDSELLP